MEEILNHLISMDDACKKELNALKQKQENIEYLVNEEISKRKDEIKNKYKFKIDRKKSEYETKLNETIQKMETYEQQKLQKIKSNYEQDKPDLIKRIIQSIVEL